MELKKKHRLIKFALLLCLSSILLFEIRVYLKLQENSNKTIALLEEGYSLAQTSGYSNYYYWHEADQRLNPKGVDYGKRLVSLLDSIYKRYSYKFSNTDHWAPGKLHNQHVAMNKQDVSCLNIVLHSFCDSFDSLFKQPYAIFYRDTIPLNFNHARKELEKFKQVIPKNGEVELYKSFKLSNLNGNEFAMIFSEWKFRFSDFIYGYELDMEPVHHKICEESFRKWKADNHEK